MDSQKQVALRLHKLQWDIRNFEVGIKFCDSALTFWFWNPTIYNIICWFAGTNDSSTKRLIFKVLFFFIISCKILFKNPFIFFYIFPKIKSFECNTYVQACNLLFYFQSIKMILGPSAAWSMRQSTQQPSVLYWRLLDFKWSLMGLLNCHLVMHVWL